MKEVLIVYYSQSGQLKDILHNVVAPLKANETVQLTFHEIQPEKPYKFPWAQDHFFDVFPETFLQKPNAIKEFDPVLLNKEYDLVILGYQIWFLTPSIPMNSFLHSNAAKKILKDTPVITVIGCRNMWIMAQEKMKKALKKLDAKLVGNIALVDRHINHVSVITISHWMFSGRKDSYLGIFPKPGVSDKDIREASKFGIPINEDLLQNDYSTLQQKLLQLDAIQIKPFLVTVDKRANFLFAKWANLIVKKGKPGEPKRLKWVKVFNYYLLFAIWFIAPIVFIVFLLTFLPMIGKIKKDKAYYSSVELR